MRLFSGRGRTDVVLVFGAESVSLNAPLGAAIGTPRAVSTLSTFLLNCGRSVWFKPRELRGGRIADGVCLARPHSSSRADRPVGSSLWWLLVPTSGPHCTQKLLVFFLNKRILLSLRKNALCDRCRGMPTVAIMVFLHNGVFQRGRKIFSYLFHDDR